MFNVVQTPVLPDSHAQAASNQQHDHHLNFNDCFPGTPPLASFHSVFSLHLFWKRMFGKKSGTGVTQAGCPSFHLTSSVRTLKRTQCTDNNQRPGLILSSSATGLITEEAFLSLYAGSLLQYANK